MSYLASSDRRILENSIRNARDAAEAAAAVSLASLEVDTGKPKQFHSDDENDLRKSLNALKYQLGNYDELVSACAYEQWHRMLFARFLAENNLLLHPTGVCVTLDECEELAREENVDVWDLASEYASSMLPGIFKPTDPLMKVTLAPEGRQSLERILDGIPQTVFTSDDGLGWVYQYWQAKKKDEVNKSERKISGSDICAVTQLFTEAYMVQFILQNTLGAWWLSLHVDSPLRDKWVYYKEKVQHDFSTWPKTVAEVRIIDPCCGSGHFLVEAMNMLLDMYREESGMPDGDAAISAIKNNLYGLEIDPRCTQIAAFALALMAWKAGAPTDNLPIPNIACCGLPLGASRDDWKVIANGDVRLAQVLLGMHDLFANARDLGSLIDPSQLEIMKYYNLTLDGLRDHLEMAFAKEKVATDPASAVFGEAARGAIRAFEFLISRYHLAVTNPPFRNLGSLCLSLQGWCKKNYPRAKKDLANCFLERLVRFPIDGAISAMVTPHNWLFLTTDAPLRQYLLMNNTLRAVARLGPHAFQEITGEVVQVALIILSNNPPDSQHNVVGVTEPHDLKTPNMKLTALQTFQGRTVLQSGLLANPNCRIVMEDQEEQPLLGNYTISVQGLKTGDDAHLKRLFWETPTISVQWRRLQGTVESTRFFGGQESMVNWDKNGKDMARLQGLVAWNTQGVAVSQMGELPVALYDGAIFDSNMSAIVPKDPSHISAIWAFCSSDEFVREVKRIDQSMKPTNATLVEVPFDLEYWQKVAMQEYPNGLPEPYSEDPTQWVFKGSVAGSDNHLQVAVARLLAYEWPEQPSEDGVEDYVDVDGIVCLSALLGERPAVDRLRDLLKAAYGSDWNLSLEESLLDQAGYKDKGLEVWLRDGFFEQHCKLFHHRPFIWHIWDGIRDGSGFSALVNYHKLDRANLEKLTYAHLGEWIRRQNEAISNNEPGAEKRLIAAENLQKKLALILEGESPHDIFIRWKQLHEQPIGWEPDLNDGVRLNIRPFMTADILRWRPNINWNKDRGKNPDGSERINDINLTIKEKRDAKERIMSCATAKPI